VRGLVVLIAGCGRVGFGAFGTSDAAVDVVIPVPDGPVPASVCGATVELSDSFDTTPAPTWTVQNQTSLTAQETGGNEQVTFAASVSAGLYAYFRSATAYSVEGMCAQAEIAGTPDFSKAGAAIYFKLRGSQLEIEFFAHDGVLDLRSHSSNNKVSIQGTVTWDPIALRFVRLRQAAGITYWDTSPDGVVYTQQAAVPGVFATTTAQLELGAGAVSTVANAGQALFASALATVPWGARPPCARHRRGSASPPM